MLKFSLNSYTRLGMNTHFLNPRTPFTLLSSLFISYTVFSWSTRHLFDLNSYFCPWKATHFLDKP